MAVYQVEPYVVAADVYGVAPHVGRGGWTWYTGSAAWMYRTLVESILGFTLEHGDTIVLRPCVPADWTAFGIDYRVPGTNASYELRITRRGGTGSAVVAAQCNALDIDVVDGAARIPLRRDHLVYKVTVDVGE